MKTGIIKKKRGGKFLKKENKGTVGEQRGRGGQLLFTSGK